MNDRIAHPIAAIVVSLIVAMAVAGCGTATESSAPSVASSSPAAVETAEPTVEPTASPTADATASAGASLALTGRIEIPDKGFAVTLPGGWNRVDLTETDIAAIMDAAGNVNEDLAEAFTQQIRSLAAAGLVVFAFGPDGTGTTNLNILALPSGGVTLDLLEQVNLSQANQIADGEVISERVTLPAGEAIHFQYDLAMTGAPSTALDQYLLIVGDNQVVLTITGDAPGVGAEVAGSIEPLD